jgi:PAS domain-containing protein
VHTVTSPYALVAEPDGLLAASYLALLSELGLQAVHVRTEAQARQVLQQRGLPLLLLLEPALEEGNGFALLSELRASAAGPAPRVVVSTAFDELRLLALQHQHSLGIHTLLPRSAPAARVRELLRGTLSEQPTPALAGGSPQAPEPPRAAEQSGPPQGELQELVEAVAQAFGVPLALLALTVEGQRREAAHVTLPRLRAEELESSTLHRVAEEGGPLVVPDTLRHPALRELPLVREGLVGSFAGALLLTPAGERLGTLCIAERRRHALGAEELEVLRGLAARMASDLESRARVRAMEREAARLRSALHAPGASLEWLREALQALPVGTALSNAEGRVVLANTALGELVGLEPARLEGQALEVLCQHVAALGAQPQALLRQLEPLYSAPMPLEAALALERPRRQVVRWVARPVPLPGGGGLLSTLLVVA